MHYHPVNNKKEKALSAMLLCLAALSIISLNFQTPVFGCHADKLPIYQWWQRSENRMQDNVKAYVDEENYPAERMELFL